MRFIIGLDEHCQRLSADIDHWRKRKDAVFLDRSLSMAEARDFCFAVLRQIFNDSMLWREREGKNALAFLDDSFAALYPNYATVGDLPEHYYNAANDFYIEVLDPLYLALQRIVETVNQGELRTWNVIHITRRDAITRRDQTVVNEHGKECYVGTEETVLQANVLIVIDGDFRILDWQRRTRSGEWKHRHPRSSKAKPREDKLTREAQENSDRFDDINNQVLQQTAALRKSKTLGIRTLGRTRRTLQ